MASRFLRSIVLAAALAAFLVGVGSALARRPPTAAEQQAIVAALQTLPDHTCTSVKIVVSTADRRFARADLSGCEHVEAGYTTILERIANRWKIKTAGTEFDCSNRFMPPGATRDLLGGSCVKTSASLVFATPSNNIACRYATNPDGYGPGTFDCYVRSSRTLIGIPTDHYSETTIQRGVAQPSDMKHISTPVLRAGESWASPGELPDFRCSLRSGRLTCKVAVWGRGFVASGAGVRAIASLPTHGPA
jgi:hypothetical protein